MLGLLAATVALVGRQTVYFPAVGVHSAPVNALVLISLAFAVTLSVHLHSDMSDVESSSARPLWRWEMLQTVVGGLTGVVTFLGLTHVSGAGHLAFGAARDFLFWLGVALLSGRLLSWELSWVAPVVLALAVGVAGTAPTGHPRPWAVPLLPADSVPAAAASGLVLAPGLLVLGRSRATRAR
ncbi:hypothetical protein [Micromonospora sp. WMMD980]|uniref:hypothetical protein n=1 Tax=Micromonospora sp. WMMD980 TaxID=3016088 RepID=UPI002417BE7A|nr:hypothetical protein [Micromonospora sp. WMMD980]MDG4802780.1 hypothetical protein [Micromonospora sp. WMMD980]